MIVLGRQLRQLRLRARSCNHAGEIANARRITTSSGMNVVIPKHKLVGTAIAPSLVCW